MTDSADLFDYTEPIDGYSIDPSGVVRRYITVTEDNIAMLAELLDVSNYTLKTEYTADERKVIQIIFGSSGDAVAYAAPGNVICFYGSRGHVVIETGKPLPLLTFDLHDVADQAIKGWVHRADITKSSHFRDGPNGSWSTIYVLSDDSSVKITVEHAPVS